MNIFIALSATLKYFENFRFDDDYLNGAIFCLVLVFYSVSICCYVLFVARMAWLLAWRIYTLLRYKLLNLSVTLGYQGAFQYDLLTCWQLLSSQSYSQVCGFHDFLFAVYSVHIFKITVIRTEQGPLPFCKIHYHSAVCFLYYWEEFVCVKYLLKWCTAPCLSGFNVISISISIATWN